MVIRTGAEWKPIVCKCSLAQQSGVNLFVCVCAAIALATVDYYNKPSIIYVVFHFASLPFNGFSKFCCLLFFCCCFF